MQRTDGLQPVGLAEVWHVVTLDRGQDAQLARKGDGVRLLGEEHLLRDLEGDLLAGHGGCVPSRGDTCAVERHLLGCSTCRQHQHILRTFTPALDMRLAPPLAPYPDTYEALLRQVLVYRQNRVRRFPWLTVRRAVWGTLLAAAEIAAVVRVSRWLGRDTSTPQGATVPLAHVQDAVPVPAAVDTFAGLAPAPPVAADTLLPARGPDTLPFAIPSAPVPPAAPR